MGGIAALGAVLLAGCLVGGVAALLMPHGDDGVTSSTLHLRDDATGGDCTSFGVWNATSRTCTMTTNITEGVVFDGDGIVLDGDGYAIAGSGSYGVYDSGHPSVTVERVTVTGFSIGVFLSSSEDSTIADSTVSGRSLGIRVDTSAHACVSENTVSTESAYFSHASGGRYGIVLSASGRSIVRDNRVRAGSVSMDYWSTAGSYGVQIVSSDNTVVIDNQIAAGSANAYYSSRGFAYGVVVDSSEHTVIQNDSISAGNANGFYSSTAESDGIRIVKSSDTIVIDNRIATGSVQTHYGSRGFVYGVLVDSSEDSVVENNSVSAGHAGASYSSTGAIVAVGLSLSDNVDILDSSISSGSVTVQYSSSGTSFAVAVESTRSVEMTRDTVRSGHVDGYGDSRGVSLLGSPDARIEDSEITAGSVGWSGGSFAVWIGSSPNTTLIRDAMVASSIHIQGSRLEDWNTHAIDTSNTVNGKPVQYWRDQVGGIVPQGAGEVILANSSGTLVRGQDLSRGSDGIELGFSSGNVIERNSVGANGWSGIILESASGNNITRNAFSGSPNGIIVGSSPGNRFWCNNVIRNRVQLLRDSSGNEWDDGKGRGNYWSDYAGRDDGSNGRVPGDGVGDTRLPAEGIDWYPLMAPCPMDAPPVIMWVDATPACEGSPVVFTVDGTDPDGDNLTYRWDFQNDGTWDTPWSSNQTATFTWGDVWVGAAKVEASDGLLTANATTNVTVLNVPPVVLDLQAYVVANVTLRVAGERWHDVRLELLWEGSVTAEERIVRTPGSPDAQEGTITGGRLQLLGTFAVVVRYTPADDPVNGQPNGANPVWVVLTLPDGALVGLHHTFNVEHPDTWTWTLDDFRPYLLGQAITLNATAHDPGSDDLTFLWDFGDGSPDLSTTYHNNGVSPDPYPSPDIHPVTFTDVHAHAFAAAGTYAVALTVTDDDGASVARTFTLAVGA